MGKKIKGFPGKDWREELDTKVSKHLIVPRSFTNTQHESIVVYLTKLLEKEKSNNLSTEEKEFLSKIRILGK